MRGLNVAPMRPPSAGRYPSYCEWPNERNSDPIPAAGSPAGPHTVRGDYSPEIRFALSQDRDLGRAPAAWRPRRWPRPHRTACYP